MPHVLVKDLPDSLRDALKSVGYAQQDVSIEPAEKASLFSSGSQGRKGFAILVDLASGKRQRHEGSWGGSNMFNPTNQVDLNDKEYPLPPGGAVINGSTGYGGTWASIKVHPSNAARWLPATSSVTPKEKAILEAYRSLKSGPYRQEALAGAGATEADILALVERKLLKRASNGATQITTEGKNASR